MWKKIIPAVSIILNVFFFANLLFAKLQPDERTSLPFLSPRIFAENQNDILINFLPLRTELRDTVEPWGDSFAFYFEYLPTGTSIGINEKVEFKAASLIKLPVAMAYMHQKERQLLTGEEIIRIEENDLDSAFGTLWQKEAGTQITLDEVVKLALIESDNTAAMVLAHRVLEEHFDAVYSGLDIDLVHDKDGKETIITAKQYASILKALYFSAVLTKKSSQEILSLLTKTQFNDKLPGGVPPGITVAHKIGILEGSLYQDCGIVYVPKRPYTLCMFSRSDETSAREHMRAISHKVYTFVSQL